MAGLHHFLSDGSWLWCVLVMAVVIIVVVVMMGMLPMAVYNVHAVVYV